MAEIIREKTGFSTTYAVWHITETLQELEAMITLRPNEKLLYSNFQVESRKKQWLAYRILVRSLLFPDDIPVEYDTSGKPFLAGCDHHISVTHSGNLAAVIISTDHRVGIDIEAIRDRILKVKEKFLHPEELDALGEDDILPRLTLAWCAKESLYKLYGHRGLDFRENIRVYLPGDLQNGKFSGHILHRGIKQNYTLYFRELQGYLLVLVTDPSSIR